MVVKGNHEIFFIEYILLTHSFCVFQNQPFFSKNYLKQPAQPFLFVIRIRIRLLSDCVVHFSCKCIRISSQVLLNILFSPLFMIYPNFPKFLIDDVIPEEGQPYFVRQET